MVDIGLSCLPASALSDIHWGAVFFAALALWTLAVPGASAFRAPASRRLSAQSSWTRAVVGIGLSFLVAIAISMAQSTRGTHSLGSAALLGLLMAFVPAIGTLGMSLRDNTLRSGMARAASLLMAMVVSSALLFTLAS